MPVSLLLFSKVTILILAIFVFIIGQLLVIFLLAYYFLKTRLSRFPNQPQANVAEEQMAKDVQNYIKPEFPGALWFSEHVGEFEHRFTKSKDGFRLHAWYLPCQDSRKTALISHGYTDNIGSIALYARYFHSRGWNVLMIDQRCHGYSGGDYIGMSVSESQDLLEWHKLLLSERPDLENIVFLGWSMGAATVLQISDLKLEKVKGIIADSSFTSVKDAIFYEAGTKPRRVLLRLIFPFGHFILFILSGVNYKRGNALKKIRQCVYPLLIFHGDQDTRVPLEMGKRLYDAAKTPKRLVIAEGSAHVRGMAEHTAQYEQALDDFLLSL